MFEFEDEEKQLDFGTDDDGDEDPAEPKQPTLRAAKEPDVDDVLDEQRIGQVLAALADCSIELSADKFRALSGLEQGELFDWFDEYSAVHQAKGADVTSDDLPKVPAFLFNPKRAKKVAKATVTNIADAAAAAEKKRRAPRRSSKEFKNSPRVAGKVSKAKGRKPEAVQ